MANKCALFLSARSVFPTIFLISLCIFSSQAVIVIADDTCTGFTTEIQVQKDASKYYTESIYHYGTKYTATYVNVYSYNKKPCVFGADGEYHELRISRNYMSWGLNTDSGPGIYPEIRDPGGDSFGPLKYVDKNSGQIVGEMQDIDIKSTIIDDATRTMTITWIPAKVTPAAQETPVSPQPSPITTQPLSPETQPPPPKSSAGPVTTVQGPKIVLPNSYEVPLESIKGPLRIVIGTGYTITSSSVSPIILTPSQYSGGSDGPVMFYEAGQDTEFRINYNPRPNTGLVESNTPGWYVIKYGNKCIKIKKGGDEEPVKGFIAMFPFSGLEHDPVFNVVACGDPAGSASGRSDDGQISFKLFSKEIKSCKASCSAALPINPPACTLQEQGYVNVAIEKGGILVINNNNIIVDYAPINIKNIRDLDFLTEVVLAFIIYGEIPPLPGEIHWEQLKQQPHLRFAKRPTDFEISSPLGEVTLFPKQFSSLPYDAYLCGSWQSSQRSSHLKYRLHTRTSDEPIPIEVPTITLSNIFMIDKKKFFFLNNMENIILYQTKDDESPNTGLIAPRVLKLACGVIESKNPPSQQQCKFNNVFLENNYPRGPLIIMAQGDELSLTLKESSDNPLSGIGEVKISAEELKKLGPEGTVINYMIGGEGIRIDFSRMHVNTMTANMKFTLSTVSEVSTPFVPDILLGGLPVEKVEFGAKNILVNYKQPSVLSYERIYYPENSGDKPSKKFAPGGLEIGKEACPYIYKPYNPDFPPSLDPGHICYVLKYDFSSFLVPDNKIITEGYYSNKDGVPAYKIITVQRLKTEAELDRITSSEEGKLWPAIARSVNQKTGEITLANIGYQSCAGTRIKYTAEKLVNHQKASEITICNTEGPYASTRLNEDYFSTGREATQARLDLRYPGFKDATYYILPYKGPGAEFGISVSGRDESLAIQSYPKDDAHDKLTVVFDIKKLNRALKVVKDLKPGSPALAIIDPEYYFNVARVISKEEQKLVEFSKKEQLMQIAVINKDGSTSQESIQQGLIVYTRWPTNVNTHWTADSRQFIYDIQQLTFV